MADNEVTEQIRKEISENEVVLFMKGTPVFPQCGFSAAVVQVLNHLGVKFKGIDVLQDPEVRQGIKEFSSWPTIPQLFVKGEFIGGCDIVRDMFQSGELATVLKNHGVETKAA
ncbi:MAG TPA: Grx4 family monothiol glutaredoxin [Alphaproteobacteria bacterium]|nr:Grx4 family monothiol glutaredoxin [Alphaproteobacteria bacterium]